MEIKGYAFLVTGGAGFVGAHLVEELLRRGAERVVVYDQAMPAGKLPGSLSEPKVTMVEGDVTDSARLGRAMSGTHGVFHLAVLPLGECEKHPRKAVDVNILGTFNVVEAAVHAGVRKLVYSSASSVYGDTLEVMDEHHPYNPLTIYGVSKLCGEFLLRPYLKQMPSVVLRYMNVYGPRQAGGLIPAVLSKILAGEAPTIHGDGSASFDFVHVRDVVRCNLLAMESEVSGEAFNVGSGTEATVKQVVAWLLEITGSSHSPIYRTDVQVPMTRRVGSSEKAKRLLGFEASVPLREGLEEVVRATIT